MIEQTAEQTMNAGLHGKLIDFFWHRTGLTRQGCHEATNALFAELNLAHLVKCKERCEALDSHVIGRSLIGYKDTFDDIKQVLSDLCKENMSLAEERDQLRAKVQELESQNQKLKASAPEHSPENRTTDP